MKRQATEWEKILIKDLPKICKEHLKFNNKTNNLINKCAKDPKQIPLQRRYKDYK